MFTGFDRWPQTSQWKKPLFDQMKTWLTEHYITFLFPLSTSFPLGSCRHERPYGFHHKSSYAIFFSDLCEISRCYAIFHMLPINGFNEFPWKNSTIFCWISWDCFFLFNFLPHINIIFLQIYNCFNTSKFSMTSVLTETISSCFVWYLH